MNSLKTRLLLSSIVVVIFFVSLTGLILDQSYVTKANSSVSLRLQTQTYDLLKIANLHNNDGLLDFPDILPDDKLMQPKSGHYAAVAHDNKITWSSKSNLNINVPYNMDLQAGERRFTKIKADDGTDLFLYSLGYVWIDEHEKPILYTFNVAEDDNNYQRALLAFRHNLWTCLIVMIVLSLIIQILVLNWGLYPLVKLRSDLGAIEEGKREYLDSNYVNEIKDLTLDLNTLLRFERARQKRYRNSLGDLAHSFKTSLSIINSTVNNDEIRINKKVKSVLIEQVAVLNDLVTYQLRRAQAAGTKASLTKPVNVQFLVNKISLALSKVYKDKNIQLSQEVDPAAMFYGDKGDLLEVLGNLLDNAHKWCKKQVRIIARELKADDAIVLTITIEDDGPGIADDKKQEILKRGVRADEHTPGHGIGMSILTDIVAAYFGEVTVADSELGGAKFIVYFKH